MKIERVWAMPNKWTFSVPPIRELIHQEMGGWTSVNWLDPFSGMKSMAQITNDIEPSMPTKYHLDALDFLKLFPAESQNGVLFDPPYSVEQCLRRYTPKHNGTAGRAEYWARCKNQIARIVKPGGKVISCCWDSTGCGEKRGFKINRILLVCHGACHNDTIVTVETKQGPTP